MSRIQQLTTTFFTLLLLLCVSSSYALSDNFLTGEGSLLPGNAYKGYSFGDISYFGPELLSGSYDYSASYTNYWEQMDCFDDNCDYFILNWGATLVAGTLNLSLTYLGQPYTFQGVITGGSFSGYECHGSCIDDYEEDEGVSFRGVWSNGWAGAGALSVTYGDDIFTGPWGFGDLQMTSGQSPEPNTLVLLGSGILGIAGILRRK